MKKIFSNTVIKWTVKALSALLAFTTVFWACQQVFVPKFTDDSTIIVHGFYKLEKNSLDALFLGASQMFCTIDSETLTDEYKISSYDFGANSQNLGITKYYFEEAMKTQSPKFAAVEICHIFRGNDELDDTKLGWNYAPAPASVDKFLSLCENSEDGRVKAASYAFAPLTVFHNRWDSLEAQDIDYLFNQENYLKKAHRGFISRDHVEKLQPAFKAEQDGETRKIPKENADAMLYLANRCKELNIELLFFKAPVSNWTRADSRSTKDFMESNGLNFLDMNDFADEIGINPDTDYYNDSHLNTSGAEKATRFMAKYINLNK